MGFGSWPADEGRKGESSDDVKMEIRGCVALSYGYALAALSRYDLRLQLGRWS